MDELTREQLLAVLDELQVGVSLYRPRYASDGTIEDFVTIYANPVLAGMIDVPDLVGHGLAEKIPENRPTGLLDRYIRVYESGEPSHEARVGMEAEAVDGIFDVHARRVGDLLMLQVVDVTAEVTAERVEAEAKALEAETFERINDAVFSLDRDWCFSFANEEAGLVLGWDVDDLIGRNVWESFPAAVGSDFERQYRHAVLYDEKVSFEAYYPEPLDTWFLVSAYPDERGLTVFFQDVGARRRVEARAADLQRMESNALLASGMAHDFNNQLMVILGHARLLEEEIGPGGPGHEGVVAIRGAGERAAELTRELIAFSRSLDLRPVLVDLDALVSELAPRLRQALPSSLNLELRLPGEPVLVHVDPAELERALLHLADNAAHAMPEGGSVTVEVATALVTEADALAHPDRSPGAYAVVTVADTGTGMSEAVQRRVLEPFFTTKRGSGATGLGLPAVHGMVRQTGGHLSIDSRPGRGTTVCLHLPLAVEPGAVEPSGEPPERS
ncbi:MAG: ATP-binding protein [Actinomycetota bacterium]